MLPDALSRLSPSDAPSADIDDPFPDDPSMRTTYRGPKGPVLDGVLLSELGADEVTKPTEKNYGSCGERKVYPRQLRRH